MNTTIARFAVASGAVLSCLVAATGASATGTSAAASGASAAAPLRVVAAAARLPAQAHVLGPLSARTTLRATVALNPSSAVALQAYATSVSTPGTPDYGRSLTVAQFARRFGARPAAIAAVEADLRAAGLRVTAVPVDGLSVEVLGTAGQLDRAFRTELERVRMPAGRAAFANADPAAVPAAIAPDVQGVIGLQDLYLEREQQPINRHGNALIGRIRIAHGRVLPGRVLPGRVAPGRVALDRVAHALTSGPAPCPDATADADDATLQGSGYTADQIASTYGFGSFYQAGDEGAGQSVALLEIEPFQATDISEYQACYGLPATAPNVFDVDDGPGAYVPGESDDGEAALDIEQVIGLAPKATIDVYQAPNGATAAVDLLSRFVSDDTAKVSSASFGQCEALVQESGGEPGITEENTLLEEAASQGQSLFVSSGDSGSAGCYPASDPGSPNVSLAVDDPASQPFATAVGGTTLCTPTTDGGCDLPDNGAYPGESVWNDGCPLTFDPPSCAGYGLPETSATGGGVSDQWPMPAYQSGAAGALDVIQSGSSRACGGQLCREVPDVSADADPLTGYAIYANGGSEGWTIEGGTSAAAPLWAAYTALVNASATCRGLTLGFENPALYQIAGTSYPANFNDITQASPFSGYADNDPFDPGLSYAETPIDPSELYPVQAGYSMATGLGTPIGGALGNALCSLRAPVYDVSVGSPGAQTTTVGTPVSLQIAATDPGSGTTLTYSASGLPAGLGMSTGGEITGTPTTTGAGTVTVTATDQFTNTATTQFEWTVAAPPRPPAPVAEPTPPAPPAPPALPVVKPGPPSLKLVFARHAKTVLQHVTLELAAGSHAPEVARIVLTLPRGLAFTRSPKKLHKGLVITIGTFKLHVTTSGGGSSLTIVLGPAETRVTISVGRPALTETKAFEKRLKGRIERVTLRVMVIDARGTPTRLSTTFRV